jgi:hypothetical protein
LIATSENCTNASTIILPKRKHPLKMEYERQMAIVCGIERLDALLNILFSIRALYETEVRLLGDSFPFGEHHLLVCSYDGHDNAECPWPSGTTSSIGMQTFLSVNHCRFVLEVFAPLVAFLVARMLNYYQYIVKR